MYSGMYARFWTTDPHSDILSSLAIAIVTEIAYGHRITSLDDETFLWGEHWSEVTRTCTRPSLVDIHPFCEYSFHGFIHQKLISSLSVEHLPSWAPGAWFVPFIQRKNAYTSHVSIHNNSSSLRGERYRGLKHASKLCESARADGE